MVGDQGFFSETQHEAPHPGGSLFQGELLFADLLAELVKTHMWAGDGLGEQQQVQRGRQEQAPVVRGFVRRVQQQADSLKNEKRKPQRQTRDLRQVRADPGRKTDTGLGNSGENRRAVSCQDFEAKQADQIDCYACGLQAFHLRMSAAFFLNPGQECSGEERQAENEREVKRITPNQKGRAGNQQEDTSDTWGTGRIKDQEAAKK